MFDDSGYALAYALVDGLGPTLIGRLLNRFGSLPGIYAATTEQLQQVSGIGRALAERIAAADPTRALTERARLSAAGIRLHTWREADYPPAFAALPDKPLVVFFRGTLHPAWPDPATSIAVVGTRRATSESLQLADAWASDLAGLGWTVISGLARGIDTAGHRGALGAGGRTVAVLGSGLTRAYPAENAPLSEQIAQSGALICEVHPESEPRAETLVLRNRLIAALSRAVIVVEAPGKSGALHAAAYAHAQGRPVFALENSAGNADLLRRFARPLPESPAALIAAIADSPVLPVPPVRQDDSPTQRSLFDA